MFHNSHYTQARTSRAILQPFSVEPLSQSFYFLKYIGLAVGRSAAEEIEIAALVRLGDMSGEQGLIASLPLSSRRCPGCAASVDLLRVDMPVYTSLPDIQLDLVSRTDQGQGAAYVRLGRNM